MSSQKSLKLGREVLWLVAITGWVSGCATGPIDLSGVAVQTEKKSNYLESVGITESNKRLASKSGQVRERVAWNGVAVFVAGIESQDLPIGSALKEELNTNLVERLTGIVPGHFELDLMDSGSNVSPLKAVLALVSESAVTLTGSGTSTSDGMYSIFGDLLFLDSKDNMQVVSSYPVGCTVITNFALAASGAQFSELARIAMTGTNRLTDGSPLSICDQVIDLIAKDSVTPRGFQPPIQVSRLVFTNCEIASVPQGIVNINPDSLIRWSDDFGYRFSGYLGTGSGLPVNPYLPEGKQTGEAAGVMERDRILGRSVQIAINRNGQNQLVAARLPKPRLLIQIEIHQLHAALNENESTMFSKTVDYGMSGTLTVINPDFPEQRQLIQRVPIEFPASKKNKLPSELADKYAQLCHHYFTNDQFGGPIDHEQIWRNKIDIFLMQLAREIAFSQEDIAQRFGCVRTKLNAGSGIYLKTIASTR